MSRKFSISLHNDNIRKTMIKEAKK